MRLWSELCRSKCKNVLLLVRAASSFEISDSAMPTREGEAKFRHPCLNPFSFRSVELFLSSTHLYTPSSSEFGSSEHPHLALYISHQINSDCTPKPFLSNSRRPQLKRNGSKHLTTQSTHQRLALNVLPHSLLPNS